MNKIILLSILVSVVVVFLFLVVQAIDIQAAKEPGTVPSPYTGLKNPFSWSDTSVQEAGKRLYQRSCQGCHGTNGSNIPTSDFSATNFSRSLEEKPDYYFWRLSEGRVDKGMPPYKSLSEEQRWQVLTYLWSLAAPPAPSKVASSLPNPVAVEKSRLVLTAPKEAQSGHPLTLTATLQDVQGKPVSGAAVNFFMKVNFFTSGLLDIGEAVTNERGIAALESTPRLTGDVQAVARYQDIETSVMLTLEGTDEACYHTIAGIQLPSFGKEVFLGLASPGVEEGDKAPTSTFRPPSGIIAWLILVVATVMLVWGTYFRVIYQVFRIPIAKEIRGTNTRLVPLAGLVVITALGTLLVVMLIHGPYTHAHLGH